MAKFTGCYLSVKDLNECEKTEDDIVLDAMNLYKQKRGKAFVLKHCWLLLKNYPRFAAIFMGKRKAGRFDPPTPNALPIDRRDLLSPNGEAPSTDSPLAQIPYYLFLLPTCSFFDAIINVNYQDVFNNLPVCVHTITYTSEVPSIDDQNPKPYFIPCQI